jgi:hypothetical protein
LELNGMDRSKLDFDVGKLKNLKGKEGFRKGSE